MFTGIIQSLGKVSEIQSSPESLRVWVETGFEDLELGESVAVNGVCLTVAERQRKSEALFYVSPETLHLTNLKNIQISSSLNLERALLASTRLSGHLVQGHVDGQASVIEVNPREESHVLGLRLGPDLARYCVHKGSITVNGVSLTLNEIVPDGLNGIGGADARIMLIPHTWRHTNLSLLRPGDEVNIETDVLAKYVEKLCQPYRKP